MKWPWFILFLVALLGGAVLGVGLLAGGSGELERAGQVPPGVERGSPDGARLWKQAERTRWWGKPLDPAQFWKGRTIWYDDSAQDAAHRYGRTWPPVPVHITNLTAGFDWWAFSRAEKAGSIWDASLDGGNVIPYHYTDAERGYWMWWLSTKLKPPAYLEALQFEEAKKRAHVLKQSTPPAPVTRALDTRGESVDGRRAQQIGMPAEAMTDEALFWRYVIKKREEYAEWQARAAQFTSGGQPVPSGFFNIYWRGLAVDRSFITNALTAEQIRAASAWKMAYLQRLRREKIDTSYIDAYLRAWNLSWAEVFPDETEQSGLSQ